MKKSIIKILLFTLAGYSCSAQLRKPDTTNSYYARLWQIQHYYQPLNYITLLPMVFNLNGNSQRDKFPMVCEAYLSPYFIFMRGRDASRPSLRSSQLAVNANFGLRMYRRDENNGELGSLPVRPVNFEIKLIATKFLHNSHVNSWNASQVRNFKFLEFTAAHYSNGQSGSSFHIDSYSNKIVPHYDSGNFSTNYFRQSYTHGFNLENGGLVSGTVYLQEDMAWLSGTFEFDSTQEKRFGRFRRGIELRYHSKGYFKKKKREVKSHWDVIRPHHSIKRKSDVLQQYAHSWDHRLKWEHIWLSDLSFYQGKKYRSSLRYTCIWHPDSWRNTAFSFDAYLGRDYFNIRYFDAVFQAQIGIVFDPNFLKPKNIKYE
jgi:hypothetical protein